MRERLLQPTEDPQELPPQPMWESPKEQPREEKGQGAEVIREKRVEHYGERGNKTGRLAELQEAIRKGEQELYDRLRTIQDFEKDLAKLPTSGWGKFINRLERKRILADMAIRLKAYEEFEQEHAKIVAEKQELEANSADSEEAEAA